MTKKKAARPAARRPRSQRSRAQKQPVTEPPRLRWNMVSPLREANRILRDELSARTRGKQAKPTEEKWWGDVAAVIEEDPARNTHSKVFTRLAGREGEYVAAVIKTDRTECRKLALARDLGEGILDPKTLADRAAKLAVGEEKEIVDGKAKVIPDRCPQVYHLHVRKSLDDPLPEPITNGTFKNVLSQLRRRRERDRPAT
jgi:hypothetical protein